MVVEDREIISAKVTPESAAGWRGFCEANGISLSAMLEVAGRQLAEDQNASLAEVQSALVEQARAIDIERRVRR